MKSTPQGYGTVAVAIHWLSAAAILALLVTGFRSGFSDDPAAKAASLRIHLPVALLVLVLTVGRLLWWWRFDEKPAPLSGTPRAQARIAEWVHRGLYLLIFVLLGSGIAMSVLSGLPDALFGAAPLPDLAALPPRTAHGIAARLIAAAILLHAGAALYHRVVLRDGTLARMWFTRG